MRVYIAAGAHYTFYKYLSTVRSLHMCSVTLQTSTSTICAHYIGRIIENVCLLVEINSKQNL